VRIDYGPELTGMADFFSYLKKRLLMIMFLLEGLTLRRLSVLVVSFISMIFKRSTSGVVPPVLIVKLTSRCNLGCIMCPKTSRSLDYYRNPVDIDTDLLTRLLEDNGKDLSLVQLHGGEPLMHRHILAILDRLNDLHLKFTITTNGHYLTPEVIHRLSKNCIRMIVSIDAATPGLYSTIRLGGDIHKIKQGIESLQDMKRETKSSLPFVRVVMAVFSYNIDEMARMVELCHEWRIPSIVFQEGMLYDNPQVGTEHLLANHKERVYAAVKCVKGLSRALGTSVRFDFDFWDPPTEVVETGVRTNLRRCFYVYFTMLLQERFRATYCFGSFDYTFAMEGMSLREQWNGRENAFYSARSDLRDNRIPPFCYKAFKDGSNCVLP
jgi:pyruvate-formate lyase-activating enzyme